MPEDFDVPNHPRRLDPAPQTQKQVGRGAADGNVRFGVPVTDDGQFIEHDEPFAFAIRPVQVQGLAVARPRPPIFQHARRGDFKEFIHAQVRQFSIHRLWFAKSVLRVPQMQGAFFGEALQFGVVRRDGGGGQGGERRFQAGFRHFNARLFEQVPAHVVHVDGQVPHHPAGAGRDGAVGVAGKEGEEGLGVLAEGGEEGGHGRLPVVGETAKDDQDKEFKGTFADNFGSIIKIVFLRRQ